MIKAGSGEIKVYIYPSEDIYGVANSKAIVESFRPLNPSTEGIGMGGGAAGLMPELHLVIVIGSSLVATGFLGALGEDIYKLLKQGITRLVGIKPKKDSLSLPPNYNEPVYTQLVWWINFTDKRALIILNLRDKKDVEGSLSKLPQFMDEDLGTNNDELSKLWWDGKEWKKND